MNDEEYYSTHDQCRDQFRSDLAEKAGKDPNDKKLIEVTSVDKLDDIIRSQKYILDKMTTMDRFIRSAQYQYRGKIMDGESMRKEIIEKFLTDFRNGSASEEDKEMVNRLLGVSNQKAIE